jgi:hypothetical protein
MFVTSLNLSKSVKFTAWIALFVAGSTQASGIDSVAKAIECGNYNPNPDCTQKTRARLHKSFGLPPIERMRKNGELIVGIMQLKRGAGLALVFTRGRKGKPLVEIFRQRTKDQPSRYPPLRTHITHQAWEAVVAKGRALGDVFAREDVYTCGATFTIEIIDEKGMLRAPVGDSCGNEPRGVYFDVLAKSAMEHLPHCAAIETEWQGDAAQELLSCVQLQNGVKRQGGTYEPLKR